MYINQGELDHILRFALHNLSFYFLGFKGKGIELQQAGWEFTVSQHEMHYGEAKLAFYMSHDSIGLSGFSPYQDVRSLLSVGEEGTFMGVECNQPVYIQQITSIESRSFFRSSPDFSSLSMAKDSDFFPIDFRETAGRETSIQEIMTGIPFAKVNLENNFEIYLGKKDEKEIMDLILRKQDLKQQEIRHNAKRREFRDSSRKIKQAEAGALLKVV